MITQSVSRGQGVMDAQTLRMLLASDDAVMTAVQEALDNISENSDSDSAILADIETAVDGIEALLGSLATINTNTTSILLKVTKLSDVTSWRTGSLQTSATGTTYVSPPSTVAKSITLFNDTGVDLVVRKSGSADVPHLLAYGLGMTYPLVANANEISLRRSDTSNTQVALTYKYNV